MANIKIAQRYAKSLYELAYRQGILENINQDLQSLANLLLQNKKLLRIIKSPLYAKEDQIKLITTILSDNIEQLFLNFLKTLIEHSRLSLLPNIADHFEHLLLQDKGQLKAYITSSIELNDHQKISILEIIKSKLDKDVILKTKIDNSLIGGFIVNFDSYQIDTSLSSKLKSLQIALNEVN